MKLKDILEQLKKEKDPLKYLEGLLKKIEDKNLKKDIKDLIEEYKEEAKKRKTREQKPNISLEQAVFSTSVQSTQTEKLEDYQPRSRRTVDIGEIPSTNPKTNNNGSYGANIKGDYLRTGSDMRKSLENKGLVSKTGFTATAESKEVIRQQYGSRDYDEKDEQFEAYSERDRRMQENLTGMSEDLRESKRKKHPHMEVYHE